ncbi:MAG TPA: endonuclease MutS2 [Firmicutes bacterium]|nr:endonuclease MutS2 [Bacillota bacterium]
MDEKTLKLLEYNKIKVELAKFATSSMGKDLVLELRPFDNPMRITHELRETKEAFSMLNLAKEPPLGGIRDVKDAILRAQKGSILEGSELLDITDTLRATLKMSQYLEGCGHPWLEQLGFRLSPLPNLSRAIDETFDDQGEIIDSASLELEKIRKELKIASARLEDRLNSLIRSQEVRKYLQDPIITLRGDRMVIPVKQECRALVPGIVHDQSASGATLFVEPAQVVDLNNNIRVLKEREKEELRRILKELSNQVGLEKDKLLLNVETLARLDFAFAKARYAISLKATEPVMNMSSEGYFDVSQARHPLLKGDVVPIDFRLGKDFNTIVITGPNTGGKTVTLKTIGLMVLMAQSGLYIPALEGSKLAFRKNVYADIGDEQSIEQSLSTFSSHLTNIISILKKADSDSLVLLDELGAGTDPQEGAALAIAILDELHQRKAMTVATTHYSDLKSYAYLTEGVENASVEFDPETLSPTYKLLIGIPGRSNALNIAQRLGLEKSVVDSARSKLSTETLEAGVLIERLEENRRLSEEYKKEAYKLKSEAEELKEKYEKANLELQKERQELIQKYNLLVLEEIEKNKKNIENLIANIRESQSIEKAQELRKEMGKKENRLKKELDEAEKKRRDLKPQKEFSIGQEVVLKHSNLPATILEIEGNKALVQAGIMKVSVPLVDLDISNKKPEKKVRFTRYSSSKETISTELNVIGKTVEEAVNEIDQYLDSAFLSGLNSVRIIHGKGTGALRKGIQDYLVSHPQVKEFRDGGQGEGGIGATVVELK